MSSAGSSIAQAPVSLGRQFIATITWKRLADFHHIGVSHVSCQPRQETRWTGCSTGHKGRVLIRMHKLHLDLQGRGPF